jgi:hypothetical protein
MVLLGGAASCGGAVKLDRGVPDAARDIATADDAADGGSSSDDATGPDTTNGHDGPIEQDAASDGPSGICRWDLLISGVVPIGLLVPDLANDRLIIVGRDGRTGAVLLGTPPRAIELPAIGEVPPQSDGAAMVLDRVRRRVLLHGGWSEGAASSRVFSMTLDATPVWSVLATSGDAPARTGHGAAMDEQGQRMFVFGGFRGDMLPHYDDTFVLSLDATPTPTWSIVPVDEPKPRGRIRHHTTWDAARRRMLIRGGTAEMITRDMWALTPDPTPVWAEFAPGLAPPTPANGNWAGGDVYDPVGDAWLVIGENYMPPPIPSRLEVFRMPLQETQRGFSALPTENAPTPSSTDHVYAATYDESSDRLYVGINWYTGGRPNQIWVLPLAGCR